MLGGNLEETYTVTIWKKEIAQSRMGGRWSVFAAVTEIFDQLREFFARWLSTKHEPIPKQRKSIRQVTIIIMISELGVSENELNYQNEIAEKTPAVAIVWTKVIFFSILSLSLSLSIQYYMCVWKKEPFFFSAKATTFILPFWSECKMVLWFYEGLACPFEFQVSSLSPLSVIHNHSFGWVEGFDYG